MAASTAIMHSSSSVSNGSVAGSTVVITSSANSASHIGGLVISSGHSSASSNYSTSTAATDSTNEHRSSSEEDEDCTESSHNTMIITQSDDTQKDTEGTAAIATAATAITTVSASSLMTSDDEEEVNDQAIRPSEHSDDDDEDTIVTDNDEEESRSVTSPPPPDGNTDQDSADRAKSARPIPAESSPSSSSLQSLSSLISLTKLSDSLQTTTNTNNNNLNNNGSNKRSGTGKLEKIFERLAKKQNNQQLEQPQPPKPTDDKQEGNEKPPTVPEQNEDCKSELTDLTQLGNESTINNDIDCEDDDEDEDDDELDEEVDDDDEDMMDEEGDDEEQMKNGFRALGLLGNVAFIGDESFKCPVCGIKLDSQHTFTLHIRSHNPNDHSNTCRLCGKTLSSASSLDRHMLIHSGERPFKCSLCGMAFTTNGNMHRHMRTHGHGSIGYTPRGAKRRAKLLAQAAAKVAAAAANGEPVDPATISKLEKSAIEVSKHPSQSLTKKRLSNGVQHSSLSDAMYALPTSMEAAAAAAVAVHAATTTNNKLAAAAAKSNTPNTPPEYSLPLSTSSLSFPTISPNTSHHHHNNHHNHHNHSDNRFESQSALNLTGRTPKSHNNITGWPVIHEKSKPGRKRKVKSSPLVQSTTSSASSLVDQHHNHNHNQHHHNQQQTAMIRCPICTDNVHTKMELHVHMASVHCNEKLFCLDCGMILDNYDTYIQHRCTGAAASAVMTALQQNPNADPELLFRSTNTNRMNFSSVSFPGLHHHSRPPQHNPFGSSGNSILNSKLSQPLLPPSVPVPPSTLSPLSLFQPQQQQHQALPKNHHHISQPNSHPFYQNSLLSSSLTRTSHSLQKSHHPNQPDLKAPSSVSSVSVSCRQCNRPFGGSKLLKAHMDTYCHECKTDCFNTANYAIHQFSHNIEKFPELSKVLEQAAASSGTTNPFSQFNAAAAVAAAASFPANFLAKSSSQFQSLPLVGAPMSSLSTKLSQHPQHSHHRQNEPVAVSSKHHHQYPPIPASVAPSQTTSHSASLDLSVRSLAQSAAVSSSNSVWPTSSSMASLTSTMADMKPDLADIQSIIMMAKHAKLPLPQPPPVSTSSHHHQQHNNSYLHASLANSGALRSPISPNRGRDAGEMAGVRSLLTGGDATNQPDSPASADSAAAAVAASSQSSQLGTSINGSEGSHNSKTDPSGQSGVSNNKRQLAETVNGTDDEHFSRQTNSSSKRRRKNSAMSSANSNPNGGPSTPSSHQNDHNSSSSSESPRFRCDSCRLSFKSMNAFRRHNRGHTAGGGHSHACHLCPYKSLDKSTLIRHLRTHNGERPFQCSICKYAFTTKANCERHVRKRHRNLKSKNEIRSAMQYNRDMAATAAATKLVSEKIYIERDELPTSQDTICKQCNEDFGTNRELRAHLRVPNNPCSQQLKPFVCTICKIGFNTRNNCVRHIIKQHPATIEMTEEEAAKVVVAEDESLMIETESSSSLSPSSNGHVSSHSLSGSLSSCSEPLSDGESYDDGLFEEEEESYKKLTVANGDIHPSRSNNVPNDNQEQQSNGNESTNGKTSGHKNSKRKSGSPSHSSSGGTGGSFVPLNLSTKIDAAAAIQAKVENVLDLSCKMKENDNQQQSGTNGLDLSVVKPPNGIKPELSGPPVSSLECTAASSLLALCHKSDTELLMAHKLQQQQQQQQQQQRRHHKDPNQMALDSFMAKLQAAVASNTVIGQNSSSQHRHSRTKATIN